MGHELDSKVQRDMRRYLKGMSLTNYESVSDVRTMRRCEKADKQTDKSSRSKMRTFERDLRANCFDVEIGQKRVAAQLIQIRVAKEKSKEQRQNIHLVLQPDKNRRPKVDGDMLQQIMKELQPPAPPESRADTTVDEHPRVSTSLSNKQQLVRFSDTVSVSTIPYTADNKISNEDGHVNKASCMEMYQWLGFKNKQEMQSRIPITREL